MFRQGNAVMTLVVSGPGTNATHLYGIDHLMFSSKTDGTSEPNPAFAIANSQVSKETETAFRSAVENFGESLRNASKRCMPTDSCIPKR